MSVKYPGSDRTTPDWRPEESMVNAARAIMAGWAEIEAITVRIDRGGGEWSSHSFNRTPQAAEAADHG